MESGENIELKDFDTVQVTGHVTAPFCISWSEDDKISLLVEDGIQVFELHPTPLSDQLSITFLRSWIPTSTSLPLQNVIVDNKANSFVWKLKRKEIYDMAIDSTLTTLVEKSSVTSFITQCIFSPLINNESYLSCLTNNGELSIYKWGLSNWSPVISVSNLWIEHWKKMNDSVNVDFNFLKLKTYQLKIVTMVWLGKPTLMFVTGHEDGGICFWNVKTIDRTIGMEVNQYFHVNGKPSCINFCETDCKETYMLIVGTLQGSVKYIRFRFTCDEKLERLGDERELWQYEDSIKPSLIQCEIIGKEKYIFTVKNHVLLIQKLTFDETESVKIKTDWHEFSSPITSFNKYQNNFIVITRNHEFFSLLIKEESFEVARNVEVSLKPNHASCFHCCGLAMSKNKAIWILVSSAKVNYDSKTLKETIHLLIFTAKLKLFKSLSDSTYTGLIKQVVDNYEDTRLTEISDLLELKKCELLSDSSGHIDKFTIDSSSPAIYLKLMLWEAKLRIFTQSAEIQNVVSQCEHLLALQWCSSRRLHYLKNWAQLSDLQKRSLSIMEVFLKKVDKSVEYLDPAVGDECPICGGVTPVENIRFSSCSNSHCFPRCSLSLLPCDKIPYAFCRLCDSTVLLDFISDNDYRCLFCDGLLVPDTRVAV